MPIKITTEPGSTDWPSQWPGDRRAEPSPGVRALRAREARDSAGGVLEQQERVAEQSLSTAKRRQESGNDDKPWVMDPETRKRANALINEFMEWQKGEKQKASDAAADAAFQRLKKAIAQHKKRKAADQKRKAADSAMRQQRAEDQAYKKMLDNEQKGLDQYKQSVSDAGARMRGELVQTPVRATTKTAKNPASSLRTRPTPAFSARSFVEVKKRSFNFGMSQEQIAADALAKHQAMGRRLRGEDSGQSEIGEIGPPESSSGDADADFAEQVRREGERQRSAYAKPPKCSPLTYADPYATLQTFNEAGEKMRVDPA